MQDLLAAASPIEIEALVDAAGFGEAVQARALRLFHELTSRLELAEIGLARHHPTEWPAHRLWVELRPGALQPLQHLLAVEPGALQLAEHPAAGVVEPDVVYVTGEDEGHAALLVGCTDAASLATLVARLEATDAG